MGRSVTTGGSGSVLPKGAVEFLRRRMAEIVAIVVLACAFAFALTLFSYTPTDISLNSATDGVPRNLLGRPGAYAADLALQAFGLAGALPALVLTAWGWRIANKRGVSILWGRLLAIAAAVTFIAIGLSTLPAPQSWQLAAGLGGVAGTLLLEHLTGLARGLAANTETWVIGLAAALPGAAALFAALGLSWAEWRSMGRTVARAVALFRRALDWCHGAADGAADRAAARRRRVEPPLTGGAVSADAADAGEAIDLEPHGDIPVQATSRLVAPRAPKTKPGRRAKAQRQGAFDLAADDEYRQPPLDLLEPPPKAANDKEMGADALEQNARLLESVLEDFGVKGTIMRVRPGPVVTLYELEPAPGTKSARVIGLSDDIARSMSAVSVRVAVIAGRNVIGIELPNARRETVHLRELLASDNLERSAGKLKLALGKDLGGAPVIVDLARMPHLLVAGTTGSGKSVALNTMVLALLYQLRPEACKFIMIDPKMLELSVYEGIPHLLCPVVTEPGKAVVALKWTVREMEERYRLMSQLGVRNIAGYNARLAEARKKGEPLSRRVQTGFDPETGKPVFEDVPLSMEALPLIVVVVDEMADLMLVAGKEIEAAVQRLSQMARAAGIHLIMATQRPSVDVITGTIKANFPTRVSFQVTSKIDSRTILGEQGADRLLGQGDMLYMAGGGRISRVHGPFVSDDEVERVACFLRSQGKPSYLDTVTEEQDETAFEAPQDGPSGEPLYEEAVALVAREGKASTSFIQRHLQIGYNRAARIVERMEVDGVVSKADRVGRREVLVGGGQS
ncbi:MAG TPA: DNA translocase FtsK 4TM domain-containing protein [Rhodospirillales bacterium]|nr:DNA translocase FtsK 4TM domain-containing protein [Rhodospirillales bacterium]